MQELHVWFPVVGLLDAQVSDLAGVLLSFVRAEGRVFGQVVVPVLLEGQVGLFGVHLLSVLQQLDVELRRVEAAGVADQDVVLSVVSWRAAVDLDFRSSFFCQREVCEVQQAEQDTEHMDCHGLLTKRLVWKRNISCSCKKNNEETKIGRAHV